MKLKEQIERRIAAWFNGRGLDAKLNTADFELAKQIMERKLSWLENGDVTDLPSINDLLEGKESVY